MRIPPNIAWPLFVIALLLAGAISTFGVLYFSQSDGGVQLVPEYTQEAPRP